MYDSAKRLLDCLSACVLLAVSAPVILLAACLVKLTSRGPAFYLQTRVGRNGRPFTMVKLRTMFHNCESLTGPRWSFPGDPRITWFGRLLRACHLDELPQLVNIIRGEMSLVGPRPERPEFVRELDQLLPGYRYRLLVRPGVTGLAQVQLPPDTDVDCVRWKLTHDLYYIAMFGLCFDLGILACTFFRVLGLPYRIARLLCGLPNTRFVLAAVARNDGPATRPAEPLPAAA